MSEIKHTLFAYDTCMCKECVSNRNRKDLTEAKEAMMADRLGPNWKNIISGMGDQ